MGQDELRQETRRNIEAILHPEMEYHTPYFERIGDPKLLPRQDGPNYLLFLFERRLRC